MSEKRIIDYQVYEEIFKGNHFQAFNINTKEEFSKELAQLRYLVVNFGGMLSRLCADMLFEEFPKITAGKNDEYIKELFEDNDFVIQCYESALENSFRGDAVFKLRSENGHVVIEDVNPQFYFPEYDNSNVRRDPVAHVFKYDVKIKIGSKYHDAIFEERHKKGTIIYSLYEADSMGKKGQEYNVSEFYKDLEGDEVGNTIEQSTGIEEFLVVHIPNYRINSSYYGISDYSDLMTLFYAINNRITKIDNILDKHGDPILAVPDGVLDEKGEVNRAMMGVVEIPSGESKQLVPEYIVWDAKLESAFSEIDKLVEFLFMVSEISPASFGMDKQGQAESGRALKFKLLRTLAKKNRKALYYTSGIKELLYIAQLFAFKNDYTAGDQKIKCKKPEKIQIEWKDGVVNDTIEDLENEQKMLENGLTTPKDAIARTFNLGDKEAEEKAKEIEEAEKAKMPSFETNPVIHEEDEEK